MSALDFGTNKAAISLKAKDRIYFNNYSSSTFYTNGFNGDYIEYSSGNLALNFVAGGTSAFRVGSVQVDIAVRLNMDLADVLNFANDAAAAAGGLSVGNVYRNGSVLMIRAA